MQKKVNEHFRDPLSLLIGALHNQTDAAKYAFVVNTTLPLTIMVGINKKTNVNFHLYLIIVKGYARLTYLIISKRTHTCL